MYALNYTIYCINTITYKYIINSYILYILNNVQVSYPFI